MAAESRAAAVVATCRWWRCSSRWTCGRAAYCSAADRLDMADSATSAPAVEAKAAAAAAAAAAPATAAAAGEAGADPKTAEQIEAMLAEREARELAELMAEREAREKAQLEKEMTKKIAMAQEKRETWCYVVHYRDPQNGMLRKYKLNFFMADSSLELIDIARDSVLFPREVYPSVTARDLDLGNTIVVYKRDLLIHSYGDEFTVERMEKSVDTDIERFKKPLQTRINGDELFYMWDSDLPDEVKAAIETAEAEKRAAAGIVDGPVKTEEELAHEAEMAALEVEFKEFDYRTRSLKVTDIPDELARVEALLPAFEKFGRVLYCGITKVVGDETWGLVTLSTAEAVDEAKAKPPVMVGEAEVFVLRLHDITSEFAEVAAASEGATAHLMTFGMADAATHATVNAFGELYMEGQREAEVAMLLLLGDDPFAESEEEEVFLEPGEEPEDWEQLKREEDFTTPNVLAVITHTLDVSGVEEVAVGPLDQSCFEPPTSRSIRGGLTDVTTLGSPRESEDGESIWSALNEEGLQSPKSLSNKSMMSGASPRGSPSPRSFGAAQPPVDPLKLQAAAVEEKAAAERRAAEDAAAIESGAAVLTRICERLDGMEMTLLQIFQKYDNDSSGSLDSVELRQALRELGVPIRKDEATKIVRQIDKDGDGCLSIAGKKTVFLSHLYIKMIIMPRQARDKHRENSKRETGFLQSSSSGCSKSATRGANEQLLFWSHFILKMLVSTQTGSGQT
jgi:hypothetical protein